jgi:phage protein U
MALVLMGLGDFRFEIPGINYSQLSRRFHYRWAPQMRIGARPVQQFMGPDEEELRLHGIIFPDKFYILSDGKKDGYTQLNAMRGVAQKGIAYPLADARGIYYGPWCIRMILDEQEYFNPDGSPRRVEFDLELVHSGNDGTTVKIPKARNLIVQEGVTVEAPAPAPAPPASGVVDPRAILPTLQ